MHNNFKKIAFGDSLKMRFSVVRKVLYTFLHHKVFIFFLILCLLPLKLPAADQPPFGDSKITISMDFQDANLKDVVKIFSIQAGLNFIASEAVQDRKITLFLDKVPIKEAMDKLFKANNLTYELDEAAKIFIVKDWGKPEIDTITKVFYLKYASVSSSSIKKEMSNQMSSDGTGSSGGTGGEIGITQAIKKILSGSGSVIEDNRTNSLIVTDVPSRMPVIEKLIASLDVSVPQVMLEVEMLDVSKNTVDKIGLEFGQNPFTFVVPGNRHVETFIGDMTKRSLSIPGAAGAIIFGHTYAEVLDFLRTQTDTKYLARPRLLTLNNETAEIRIATNEAIGVNLTTTAVEGTGSSTAQAERSETGVVLRVTPQVSLDTGEITMFVYPMVAEAVQGTAFIAGGSTYQYRDPEERSTKSIVRIKDGETILIGGLIRTEYTNATTKIPILGDIPIVGALFRHKNKTKDKERELIIFITPHIIKDTNIEFAQVEKTVLLKEEQKMTSVSDDRQAVINTMLNSFEKIK